MITPGKRLASMQQRMKAIVEHADYPLREKRIRAMAQLERVLEVVMASLPQEQQRIVQEVVKLYEQVWSSE